MTGSLVQAPLGRDFTASTERLSDLRHTAVNEQFAASDKTGVAGREEQDSSSNFLGSAHGASRDERNEPVHGLLGKAIENGCINGARADHIDPDIPLP